MEGTPGSCIENHAWSNFENSNPVLPALRKRDGTELGVHFVPGPFPGKVVADAEFEASLPVHGV